jgi:SPOR domain
MADDTYSRGYRNDPYDRGGTGASSPATDPLTELARLIGQSDPFAVDGNRRPDPHAVDPYAQPTAWQADPAQQQHYGNDAHDDRYDGAPEQPQYAGNGYAGADAYAAHPNDQAYAAEPPHDAGYDARGYVGQQAYHQDPPPYQQSQQPYYGANGGGQQAQDPHAQGLHAQGPHAYDQQQPQANVPEGYPAAPYFGAGQQGQDEEYYDDAPAPARRGWLVTAAALIGLTVIGVAGAFAYRAVFTPGSPSIITRDVQPNKIVPLTASNDNGASKQIDRLAAAGQNERLAPPPEQPINIPDPVRTAPPAVAGPPMAPAVPNQPGPPADTAGPAPTAPGNGGNPRKIRTVTIKSDQGPADTLAPRPAPRALAPNQPAQPRIAAPAPPPPSPNAPLSLAPQGLSNAPAPPPAHAAAPPVHTTALAPSAPVAEGGGGGGGGYFVQVSAQKSQEEARSSFRSMQSRYASVLGGHNPVFRRKDLGPKGVFYGAQVGPFSREGAAQLCESLKSAGGTCMIQRN